MCFHFANDFRLCHHQNDKNEIYNVAKSRFLFHFIIKYTYTKIKLINYGSRARCVCAYCCWYIQMVFFVISNETSLKCVIFLFKTWDHFKSFSYNKCISHFLGRHTHTHSWSHIGPRKLMITHLILIECLLFSSLDSLPLSKAKMKRWSISLVVKCDHNDVHRWYHRNNFEKRARKKNRRKTERKKETRFHIDGKS